MSDSTIRGRYDLTAGPILNRLLLVALPIMGSQLMTMIYNLVDMFWLGRLGSTAVAASGTAGMFLWLVQALMMVGRMGSEIGVAQSLGRRDERGAMAFAQDSLLLAILLGAASGALLLFARRPLLSLFNIQEAALFEAAALYLAIVSLGVLPSFVSGSLGGVFTGSGNARTPFVINAAGVALNLLLDPLLIFGLGWGIAGAALATAVAQVVVCALFLLAAKRHAHRPFADWRLLRRPQRAVTAQIARWSTPIALESLFFCLMSMVISRLVISFGTDAVAVQRVGSQIESLTWLVGGGFASAVTAFVGQNCGAGLWGRIRRGLRASVRCMLGYGAAATLLLYFGGGALFRLFLPEPALVEIGAEYLRILSLCQMVGCLEYMSAGAFRGIGRPLPSSIVTTCANALRIPMVYLLGARMGLTGVWWGLTLGAGLRGVWMIAWLLLSLRRTPREDQPEPGTARA